jgi:hypothetical protein
MDGFTSLIGNWHFWVMVGSYYTFAAAVGAMPSPDSTSGKFYAWFFKFSNTLAANLTRAAQGKIPGMDVMPEPKPETLNAVVPAPPSKP